MTKQLQELVDQLSELPGPVRNAVVQAIRRNISEHHIAEEYAPLEVEDLPSQALAGKSPL